MSFLDNIKSWFFALSKLVTLSVESEAISTLGKITSWAFALFGFAVIAKGLYMGGLRVTLFGVVPLIAILFFMPSQTIGIAKFCKLLLLFFTALMTYFYIGLLIIDDTIKISNLFFYAIMYTGTLALFIVISGLIQKNKPNDT